jgi:integrase
LLPQQLADLIELYSSAYRPVLEPDHASTWMFPGRTGCHKSRERLALQISETIKKQLGLLVNVHLFRAISAKVYLDRNPGGYGIIKNLHGHKSLETTIRSYCGLEGKSAIAHFDKFIIQERKTVAPAPSGRARRKAVAPALRGPDRGKDASP